MNEAETRAKLIDPKLKELVGMLLKVVILEWNIQLIKVRLKQEE